MSPVDIGWIVFCSTVVMGMQAGFCCLEAGLVRAKNSINVAIKNAVDFVISTIFFWSFGFAIMFGPELPNGTSAWFLDANENIELMPFFLFHLMFCGTATTLIGGALAERTRYSSYLWISAMVSAVIYPVIGNWSWAGLIEGNPEGWLEAIGFYDFAGSTVVHSSGGWVALAAILIIGPRIGRFGENSSRIQGHNLPMATLGVMLLWIGWIGFNGGSTMTLDETVPVIIVTTILSGAAGGLVGHLVSWRMLGVADVSMVFTGIIAGLVGITASADVVSTGAAVTIGAISGALSVWTVAWLERREIDDAIGVLPAHLVPGIWGTLAVAIFGDMSRLPADTRLDQLGIQLSGVVICAAWCFGVSWVLLSVLNRFSPMRVTEQDELDGLNLAEHGATTEVRDLLMSMSEQRLTGSYKNEVNVATHTDTGQIATEYNHVMRTVMAQQDALKTAHKELSDKQMSYNAMDRLLDTLLSCDAHGQIVQFNPAALSLFGYSAAAMRNMNLLSLLPDAELIETNDSPSDYLAVRRDGTTFESAVSIRRFLHEGESKYAILVRDVSTEKELKRQLIYCAKHDTLTGLPNRTLLNDRLDRALTRARRNTTNVSVLFLDVDGFKPVNDTHGHGAGDVLLQQIAERLHTAVRESDTVARVGGDEFVIVLEHIGSFATAEVVAQKILDTMSQHFTIEVNHSDVSISIGMSIGISEAISGNAAPGDLFRQADTAMYIAKKAGRNQFFVHNPVTAMQSLRRQEA